MMPQMVFFAALLLIALVAVYIAAANMRDARRYRWLRTRNADDADNPFAKELLFIGKITPPNTSNLILTGADADRHIDAEMTDD